VALQDLSSYKVPTTNHHNKPIYLKLAGREGTSTPHTTDP